MIAIRDLRKHYGAATVLDGVSLDIAHGRVTAILGPNAAGKTTLIKSMLGLTRPDSGTIHIAGRAIDEHGTYRAGIGYMPQIARYPDNLTGADLLAMMTDLRSDAATRDEELVERLGLRAHLATPLRVLSGGTRQKVNVALAFLFAPPLLILDEPTAGLDPVASRVVKDKIAAERARGRTIVLTSHVMSELEELADDVVFLIDGRIRFAGAVRELKVATRQLSLERAIAHVLEQGSGRMIATTRKIARYGVRDLMRSRWLLAYSGFFFAVTWALLRFSDTETKALLGLVNVVLLIVPLANVVFGAMYLYGAREFVELLLAQPVRRRDLFGGLYLGLVGPVAAAAVVGIVAPLVLQGASGTTLRTGAMIASMAVALSAVFTGLAAIIAYRVDDRVRGLATALGVWLLLAVVYDGLVLIAAVQLAAYPLERPLLGLMLANPIDLARLVLLLQFDAAALLGYTGAVFERFFAGASGVLVAGGAIALWTVCPALVGARLFRRKDF